MVSIPLKRIASVTKTELFANLNCSKQISSESESTAQDIKREYESRC